ncbi:MBL fold metallo-hydrolase [Histidinibacterium aquaticum]|uniref:MBL fold metallo-hydrolase n=1 Tax=Histidinibacterium aquaticum TaxID=2613962 RepID=A0A5J5GQV4_9RHOB|nr:MBL fold metallo-hydrolase [Histidinibacterium aquaticum]KAA9009938.1 MBL fold metallo-hydrolase [Histidinibacterium aquaticum]
MSATLPSSPAQGNAPRPGIAEEVAEGVLRVLAPNPSPMTFWGTNSYIVGRRDLLVVDPGPDLADHREALRRAIGGRPVRAVVLTHAHRDHAELAAPLARELDVPVLAGGAASDGRSAVMSRLAAEGLSGGGEGVIAGFVPDRVLADGEGLEGDGWRLEVLRTPGHMGHHICLLCPEYGLSGDHVMGWASTMISPPDGDVAQFLESCRRLREHPPALLLPGHGPAIEDPVARIDRLVRHRRDREAQLLEALGPGDTVSTLTARLYAEVPPSLHPAAARNVFAHLADLHERGLVTAEPGLSPEARFAPARTA